MNNRYYVFVFWLVLFCFNSAFAAKPKAPDTIEGVTTVSAKQLIQLIINNPSLVIIDSRYHQEYIKGHIEGSINILNTDMSKQRLEKITRSYETPIVFYCNGIRCLRSSQAASKARLWGFQHIYWYRQGWVDWVIKQYPIEH